MDIATDVFFVLDGLVMINTGVRLNSESGELGANSFIIFMIIFLFYYFHDYFSVIYLITSFLLTQVQGRKARVQIHLSTILKKKKSVT